MSTHDIRLLIGLFMTPTHDWFVSSPWQLTSSVLYQLIWNALRNVIICGAFVGRLCRNVWTQILNFVMLDLFYKMWKFICISIISQHWDGTGSFNPSLWKTMPCVCCKVNTMVRDDLACSEYFVAHMHSVKWPHMLWLTVTDLDT